MFKLRWLASKCKLQNKISLLLTLFFFTYGSWLNIIISMGLLVRKQLWQYFPYLCTRSFHLSLAWLDNWPQIDMNVSQLCFLLASSMMIVCLVHAQFPQSVCLLRLEDTNFVLTVTQEVLNKYNLKFMLKSSTS